MDPSATEFIMNPNRAPSGRPAHPPTSQDGSQSRCPALRHSYDTGMPSTTSPPRTTPAYDPVHHGHQSTWWNSPYHHHHVPPVWHHPTFPALMQPRLPGSRSDPTSMLAGQSSQYPARQHPPHGMGSLLGGTNDYVMSSQPFNEDRYSGAYLPSIGGFEPFSNPPAPSRSQNLSHPGHAPGSLAQPNPLPGPFGGDSSATDLGRTGPGAPVPARSPLDTWAPRSIGRSEDGQENISPQSANSEDGSPAPSQTASAPRWISGTRANSPPRVQLSPTRYITNTSDYSSDEEAEFDPFESEAGALLMLDANVDTHTSPEQRMRAQQVLRGMLSSRRVASGRALDLLESVDIADLPEDGKACVICYNEYGVPAPENITETPLRLPKCKHIFGNHCIKKWFEDNDTCPYCRDKVPSQTVLQYGNRQNMVQFMRSHHIRTRNPLQDNNSGSLQALLRYRPGAAPGDAFLGPSDSFVRRSDGYRSAAWNSRPRSPQGDLHESRRRTRARHGGLRGSPPSGRSASYSATIASSTSHLMYGQGSTRAHYHSHAHAHAHPSRPVGGLPSLGHTLAGSGMEDQPYLLENFLRPSTNSGAESSSSGATLSAAPNRGASLAFNSAASPLSPTMPASEPGMTAQA